MEQKPVLKKCASAAPGQPGNGVPPSPPVFKRVLIIDSDPIGVPPSDTISFAQSGSIIKSRGQALFLVRPGQVQFFEDEHGKTVMQLPEFQENPHAGNDPMRFFKYLLK